MSSIPMDLNEILRRLAAVESSGGLNTNHATITNPQSVHYGDAAIGNFGLMPNTAQAQVGIDPDLADLRGLGREALGQQMRQDPALQQRIASELLRDLMQQFPNNPEAVAAAWYSGPEAARRLQRGAQLQPDEAQYIERFRGVPSSMRLPEAPQQQAAALHAPAPGPPAAPLTSAPARILDDYDSRRLALGGQQPGQATPSGFVPWDEPGEAMWVPQSGAPTPGMAQWQPPPAPQRQPAAQAPAPTPIPEWATGGFEEPPPFLDAVRAALGQAPESSGMAGSQPQYDEPMTMDRIRQRLGVVPQQQPDQPLTMDRIISRLGAGGVTQPVTQDDPMRDASESFGRFRSWDRGSQPEAQVPRMPPLSPSEHGRAWATPPHEFSDPRQMFMRGGAQPGTLSDSYQEPAPEKVKDAEMALAYHMKSYDPVGLLTAEQRQRSLGELTNLMTPQQPQGDNMLMGLGRAFAAGGHAAGVEPLSRAFGVMQGERARQDALALQADQQRRAQVNDLTQLLAQDRQAQALDYQINKPQDTITMPGVGEIPAASADDIMRAQWQGGAQGRWEAEQKAQQGQWAAQNQLGRDELAGRERNWESLATGREAAADARVLNGARNYAAMVLRMNEMQRRADPTVQLVTEEQAWQMALSKMQEQDPNAPADLNAAIAALGSRLVTNGAPQQPPAGGAATQVASGQLVDPKTRLPVPR